MTSPVIDPRLSDDLAALLDAHEVPHDNDALLWEFEKRGYNIGLDGPDVRLVNPEGRWTLRVFTNERDPYGHPIDRKMFHGQTSRIALARGFAWIVSRGDDE